MLPTWGTLLIVVLTAPAAAGGQPSQRSGGHRGPGPAEWATLIRTAAAHTPVTHQHGKVSIPLSTIGEVTISDLSSFTPECDSEIGDG